MEKTNKPSKGLRRFDQALAAVRSACSPLVSAQVVHTFNLVAQHEGLGVVELAQLAGATKATMSRHLLDLSERLRNGDQGYGLLQRTSSPSDLRAISYTLTSKGKLLKRQIEDIMED